MAKRKRKGKYVVRHVWAGNRERVYFRRKEDAKRFVRCWGIKAAIRENV